MSSPGSTSIGQPDQMTQLPSALPTRVFLESRSAEDAAAQAAANQIRKRRLKMRQYPAPSMAVSLNARVVKLSHGAE